MTEKTSEADNNLDYIAWIIEGTGLLILLVVAVILYFTLLRRLFEQDDEHGPTVHHGRQNREYQQQEKKFLKTASTNRLRPAPDQRPDTIEESGPTPSFASGDFTSQAADSAA